MKEAAENAKTLLEKVSKNMAAEDETASIKMEIIEASGSRSERRMEVLRKGKGRGQKVLVRIDAPARDRGIALLSKPDGEGIGQWLYLPSKKQVRRISGASGKGGAFLGSELSNEDLAGEGKFSSSLLGAKSEAGKKFYLVENIPQEDSSYGKTVVWVDANEYLVRRVEYFDKELRLLKTTEFKDYKRNGGAWRAQTIEVSNSQNKRGTRLEVSAIKLNGGLADSEFSESALTEVD
jgi:uncharacterized protein